VARSLVHSAVVGGIVDVIRLDGNYRPDVLVEGWSSMIWTERYPGNGEFSMNTPLISDARALIPEGTFISLLDSEEVMQVETHSIERDEQGGVVNKISGSSYPHNFLSERDTVGAGANLSYHPNNWRLRKQYSPAEAAAALLWNHLINNSTKFTGPEEDLEGIVYSGGGDARLLIPNLELTMTAIQAWTDPNPGVPDPEDPAEPGRRRWYIDRSGLDKPVFDFLAQGKLGLRSRRPNDKLMSLVTFLADGGIVHTANASNGQKLRLDVYQGRDLTETVTFRYDAGQIEKPTYLYSIKGYKNIAHVSSMQRNLLVAAPGVDPNVSGINRRVLPLDFGDLSELDVDGIFTDADWDRILTQKALAELENYNKVALFDGEISPLNAIKYGKDYTLGDKVTLQAEYDLEATMVVSEYIRAQDENGETGYPTLSMVED